MVGRSLTEADRFSFRITDVDGKVLGTAVNDGSGKIAWPTLAFTEADVGMHLCFAEQTGEDRNGLILDRTRYAVPLNVLDKGDGTLEVRSTDAEGLDFENTLREYTVTYDPNGGTWSNGSRGERLVTLPVTEGCRILEAPTRSGYTFREWKGSSYQPGDAYNEKDARGWYVSDTLVAQWEQNRTPSTPDSKGPKTGEPAKVLQWSLMMVGAGIALLGVTALLPGRRRKKKRDPSAR